MKIKTAYPNTVAVILESVNIDCKILNEECVIDIWTTDKEILDMCVTLVNKLENLIREDQRIAATYISNS